MYLFLVERRGSPREFNIPQAHRQPETPRSKIFDGIYGIQIFWICMDPHWFCSTGFGSGSALAIWKGIHELGRLKLKSFTLSVADPDPHNFGKLDTDPVRSAAK